jgi:hypothetical protein
MTGCSSSLGEAPEPESDLSQSAEIEDLLRHCHGHCRLLLKVVDARTK